MDYNKGWNERKYTNMQTVPKWLKEISKSMIGNNTEKPQEKTDNESRIKEIFNYSPSNNDITTNISHLQELDEGVVKTGSSSKSAKYGRRSSVVSPVSQLEGNNLSIKSPKFDLKTLKQKTDVHQLDLEKSWKSLDDFNHSHKGRLDSAKDFDELIQGTSFDDFNLSPISSTEDNDLTIYSPSILEPFVPNRSRSEMSNYLPFYVYNNIKQITEPISRNSNNKSKSTESIPSAINLKTENYDPIFEKKLNDYHSKLDKENRLRDEIISELLLTENEKITGKLNEEFRQTTQQKLYHTNSKYKTHQQNIKEIFIIPELPKGKTLVIDIISTWGDKYYVGLNGIEIFDKNGHIVKVKKITAIPPDVNILPECNNDPRIVKNLLDGVNRTQDDMHIWLAPFETGCNHLITIEFYSITTIAMIRIWNYNKSRIHSYRGVRDIVIFLDDLPIFKGEIAKACGGILGGVDAFGDTILFTTNDEILENISKNDTSYSSLTSEPNTPITVERPPTATLTSSFRPITGPVSNNQSKLITEKKSPSDQILLGANQIDLILITNWGYMNKIGLTGIEIVQGNDNIIKLSHYSINCNKKGKLITNLINGKNLTIDERNMWRTNFNQDQFVNISIKLEKFSYISGLRIWNYNSSLETSYMGVRNLKILLDGKPVENPLSQDDIFLLRRAPGNLHYDYVQEIKFTDHNQLFNNQIDIEDELLVEGFIFQIIIFSSWGDQYYCGLNGLELYDQNGMKISLEEQNVCAYPESVNSLPNVTGDIRTPDKLIDGVNNDHSGLHSWLAPIIPKHLNRIYIVMDQPIIVSFIKFWNYSKTPNRGIKEFGILVDDLLVYNGTLEKYCNSKLHQTVLFTENQDIINQEYDNIIRNSDGIPESVILMDENLRNSTTGGSLPEADPALRPFTSVSPFNRGFTSQSH